MELIDASSGDGDVKVVAELKKCLDQKIEKLSTVLLQLSENNEDSEADVEDGDPSEIESILKQTAHSINAFKNRIEDERDARAVDEAKKSFEEEVDRLRNQHESVTQQHLYKIEELESSHLRKDTMLARFRNESKRLAEQLKGEAERHEVEMTKLKSDLEMVQEEAKVECALLLSEKGRQEALMRSRQRRHHESLSNLQTSCLKLYDSLNHGVCVCEQGLAVMDASSTNRLKTLENQCKDWQETLSSAILELEEKYDCLRRLYWKCQSMEISDKRKTAALEELEDCLNEKAQLLTRKTQELENEQEARSTEARMQELEHREKVHELECKVEAVKSEREQFEKKSEEEQDRLNAKLLEGKARELELLARVESQEQEIELIAKEKTDATEKTEALEAQNQSLLEEACTQDQQHSQTIQHLKNNLRTAEERAEELGRRAKENDEKHLLEKEMMSQALETERRKNSSEAEEVEKNHGIEKELLQSSFVEEMAVCKHKHEELLKCLQQDHESQLKPLNQALKEEQQKTECLKKQLLSLEEKREQEAAEAQHFLSCTEEKLQQEMKKSQQMSEQSATIEHLSAELEGKELQVSSLRQIAENLRCLVARAVQILQFRFEEQNSQFATLTPLWHESMEVFQRSLETCKRKAKGFGHDVECAFAEQRQLQQEGIMNTQRMLAAKEEHHRHQLATQQSLLRSESAKSYDDLVKRSNESIKEYEEKLEKLKNDHHHTVEILKTEHEAQLQQQLEALEFKQQKQIDDLWEDKNNEFETYKTQQDETAKREQQQLKDSFQRSLEELCNKLEEKHKEHFNQRMKEWQSLMEKEKERHAQEIRSLQELYQQRILDLRSTNEKESKRSLDERAKSHALELSKLHKQHTMDNKHLTEHYKQQLQQQKEENEHQQQDLKQEIWHLSNRLQAQESSRQVLEKEEATIRSELEQKVIHLETALSALKRDQTQKEEEHRQECQKQKEALAAQLHEIASQNDASLDAVRQDLDASSAARRDLEDRLQRLRSRFDARESRSEDLAQIAALQSEKEHLLQQHSEMHEATEQLKRQMLLREENYNKHFRNGGAGDRVLNVHDAFAAPKNVQRWLGDRTNKRFVSNKK